CRPWHRQRLHIFAPIQQPSALLWALLLHLSSFPRRPVQLRLLSGQRVCKEHQKLDGSVCQSWLNCNTYLITPCKKAAQSCVLPSIGRGKSKCWFCRSDKLSA